MKVLYTKSASAITFLLRGRSNVFLLSSNDKTILIDCGTPAMWPKLKRQLNKLKIEKIDYLILTHTHFDHAGNSAKIKKEFDAEVVVNSNELSHLENGSNIMIHGTNILTRFLTDTAGSSYLSKLSYQPCTPGILVDRFLDMRNYGMNCYILHTPGHSSGSQSLIVDNEIALVGDAMFGVFPGSVFPPYAMDEAEMIRSWGKLIDTGCSLFLPSHGSPRKIELLRKEFLKRERMISSPKLNHLTET